MQKNENEWKTCKTCKVLFKEEVKFVYKYKKPLGRGFTTVYRFCCQECKDEFIIKSPNCCDTCKEELFCDSYHREISDCGSSDDESEEEEEEYNEGEGNESDNPHQNFYLFVLFKTFRFCSENCRKNFTSKCCACEKLYHPESQRPVKYNMGKYYCFLCSEICCDLYRKGESSRLKRERKICNRITGFIFLLCIILVILRVSYDNMSYFFFFFVSKQNFSPLKNICFNKKGSKCQKETKQI